MTGGGGGARSLPDRKATRSAETAAEFKADPQIEIRFFFLKHGASTGSAFKITSEQVSSVCRANPLPRQKARVTGRRCYFRNPCHLLPSTSSKNHSPGWGPGRGAVGGTEATTRQAGGRAATEATARAPSIPAGARRGRGLSTARATRGGARGQQVRPGLGLAGVRPGADPRGRAEGRGAPGRERGRGGAGQGVHAPS